MPRIGQAVKVFSGDGKTFLGTGKYTGSVRADIFGMKLWIPKLKVGKKIYYGYQCYWITVSEANKVEKKLNIKIK